MGQHVERHIHLKGNRLLGSLTHNTHLCLCEGTDVPRLPPCAAAGSLLQGINENMWQ